MLLAPICLVQTSPAAMDPRFELDPRVLAASATKPATSVAKSTPSAKSAPSAKTAKRRARSRVRPASRQAGRGAAKKQVRGRIPPAGVPLPSVGYWSHDQQSLQQINALWDRLIPTDPKARRLLTLDSPTVSLTLDPQQYPLFSTMDGFLILLDRRNSLPPVVRALIEEKEGSLRIVNASPADGRRFWGAMLDAARFYSTEENFNVEFGRDPKLIVHADFKIERRPDSILTGNVVLLNYGRFPLSGSLKSFLGQNGFTLYETSPLFRAVRGANPYLIKRISERDQPQMAGAILRALGVSPGRARRIDVFAGDGNGIRLSVKADYAFVHEGETYLVCFSDGDPLNLALLRSLETRGYRVVVLETRDDFYATAGKILAALKIGAKYELYDLINEQGTPISLQMSGFLLDDPAGTAGLMLLTDVELDGIVRTLLNEFGFGVNQY